MIQIKTKFNRDKEFTYRKYYSNNDGKLEKEEAYFQKRKRLAYSYTHLYDKMMHKESIILVNDSGKELEEEIFYNEDDKIMRIVRPIKNSLYSNKIFYKITEYRYYSNGLLFEKKSESAVERYYYLSGHDDQH